MSELLGARYGAARPGTRQFLPVGDTKKGARRAPERMVSELRGLSGQHRLLSLAGEGQGEDAELLPDLQATRLVFVDVGECQLAGTFREAVDVGAREVQPRLQQADVRTQCRGMTTNCCDRRVELGNRRVDVGRNREAPGGNDRAVGAKPG